MLKIRFRMLFTVLFALIVCVGALSACGGSEPEQEPAVVDADEASAAPTVAETAVSDPTPLPPEPTAEPEETAVSIEPTAAATDTPTAAIEAVPVELSELNQTATPGFYSQINYFGFFHPNPDLNNCINFALGPDETRGWFVNTLDLLGLDHIDQMPTLTDKMIVLTCAWEPGDEITAQVTTPSGETLESSLIFAQGEEESSYSIETALDELVLLDLNQNEAGDLRVEYLPGPDRLPGEYTFTIAGNGRSVEHTFTVLPITEPTLFRTVSDEVEQIHLTHFAPEEPITLVTYGYEQCISEEPMYAAGDELSSLCFNGWQTLSTDANGRLLLQLVPYEASIYTAIVGEQSGTFPLDTLIGAEVVQAYRSIHDGWLPTFSTEPGGEPLRLHPDNVVLVLGEAYEQARVQLADGTVGWMMLRALDSAQTAVANDSTPIFFDGDLSTLPEWAHMPEGQLFMGTESYTAEYTEPAEQPAHLVNLNEFWVQRTEVSNASYAECVAAEACTPPQSATSATRADYYANDTFADHPVINVNHEQAAAYCDWINGRLPTEAEWEYAARYPNENSTYYTWGSNAADANATLANFNNNKGDTMPVTELLDGSNQAGLLNLHGNVWEWTADWFAEAYYKISPEENPQGPESGDQKVARGGAWSTEIEFLSLTNRFARDFSEGYNTTGFRCVRSDAP